MLFVFPLVQRNFKLFNFQRLKGEYSAHQKPSITLSSWLDGSYQKAADNYCTDSFGFRNPLVRGINELDFQLFREANAKYVIIGKDNGLFETPYIEAHLGMDYLGDSVINQKVLKYKQLHDTLAKLGVQLTMVFAPGKASYHPEYIPDYYWQYQTSPTNYSTFKQAFEANELPFLDFHLWFRKNKSTTPYPLFPLTGIHWSKYGMLLATDSLLSYWDSKTDKRLPSLDIGPITETTSQTQGSDADVEDGLNIIQTLPHFNMAYPNYQFIDSISDKIRTAVIADSYYWGLFDIGLSTIACDSGEFWYYFKQVYPQNFESGLMIKDLDLQKALESKDHIVLLQTDATLKRFGFGFVEDAWTIYFN